LLARNYISHGETGWGMNMGNQAPSRRTLRALAIAFPLAASAAFATPRAPVVATKDGPVRGALSSGIDRYLGIPYAAAPVGDLRWRPPQPHGRWHGVRDATRFANHCPQNASPYGLASITEDCLYLNVFTPARVGGGDDERDDDEDGRLPVMVWIHGGALNLGESDDYDPVRLVRQDVVVVTLNYRLGMLGFLAHPALSAESPYHGSGNYGLMDQQAALRWVQRNIAAFGGDPRRVTIFGESAGGLSSHSHLASPLSAGLFHRAIVESGAYALAQLPLAGAQAQGTVLASAAGCADQTAACLRAAPVEALLRAIPNTASVIPNVDGKVLTQTIGAAFSSGQFNRVPVIEGSNHDEWRLFVLGVEPFIGPLTPATYLAGISATLGVNAATAAFLATLYPLASYPSPSTPLALAAIGTDAVFACNSRKAIRLLSQYVPVHAYEFNDENAPQLFLPPVSFPYGSAHASEIQYLFNLRATVPAPALTPDQERLSGAMVAYWTNFAKLGNPNWFGTPFWPAYDAASDRMQSLVPPTPAVETGFAADHKCAFWAPTP
jgi:para-nitrobenzyl esterase